MFSGSVAAALSAGAASASAPSALVASTIKAASLLAAGQAAGVVSAKVAALIEGVVKTMFVTKIKSVLAVALVVATLASVVGMIYQTQAAEPTKNAQKKAEEKPVPAPPTPQPAKTDRELMLGNWYIMNEDSQRKGEMWAIDEDSILMHAKDLTPIIQRYAHRLDASKNPKQIDIMVTRVKGPLVGVIKGIYVLDGDELRLCLGEMDKVRPAAFPAKPAPGEVLILQRAPSGASPPKAKEKPPGNNDLERMAGLWTIVNGNNVHRDDGLGSMGQIWEIGKHQIVPDPFLLGKRTNEYFHRLDSAKSPKQIDITVTAASSEVGTEIPIKADARIIGIIKGIYELDRGELRLCLGEMGKDRPTAFPEKPKPGEILILNRFDPKANGGAPEAKKADGADKAKEESPTPPVAKKKDEKPLHFVEKPDMKPEPELKLPFEVPLEMDVAVPSKVFIANIRLPGRIRFRELLDPRYLKKHGLTDRDIAYEILDHQGLDGYEVADDLRTVLFVVDSKGGGKELIIVRWVVYEGHLYIAPEKAPDPKTGIFTPWILRTVVRPEPPKQPPAKEESPTSSASLGSLSN
jgi:uncharacterized protein (TIGR03067 family)